MNSRSYERQAGESGASYAAFCLYRDLGPQRSVDAAYTLYLSKGRQPGGNREGKSALKNAPGRWWQWASEMDWKIRCEAFDEEREREDRETAIETRRLEVETYRARVVSEAQARAAAAAVMLDKAMTRLNNLDPAKIPITSLPAFLKAATQAWRDALELEGIGLAILDEDGNLPDDDF